MLLTKANNECYPDVIAIAFSFYLKTAKFINTVLIRLFQINEVISLTSKNLESLFKTMKTRR